MNDLTLLRALSGGHVRYTTLRKTEGLQEGWALCLAALRQEGLVTRSHDYFYGSHRVGVFYSLTRRGRDRLDWLEWKHQEVNHAG